MIVPTRRILICGSRSWDDWETMRRVLRMYSLHVCIVHGDAPEGADHIADQIAWENGNAVDARPAKWSKYGKSAGMIRNQEMLDSGVNRVVAFWDGKSPGTKDTIERARKMGIPCCVILGGKQCKQARQTKNCNGSRGSTGRVQSVSSSLITRAKMEKRTRDSKSARRDSSASKTTRFA